MFTQKNNNSEKILSAVENAAGGVIRKLPKDVQADAWQEGVVAYLEHRDITGAIKQWWKKERRYHSKEQSISGAKPRNRDITEIKQLRKDMGY